MVELYGYVYVSNLAFGREVMHGYTGSFPKNRDRPFHAPMNVLHFLVGFYFVVGQVLLVIYIGEKIGVICGNDTPLCRCQNFVYFFYLDMNMLINSALDK